MIIFFLFLILFFLTASKAQADIGNNFITIVNPVRISAYTKDIRGNLAAQYKIIKDLNLPATWLLTYDAILDSAVNRQVIRMSEEQEIGIFLEISEKFAADSGVLYHKSGSWHYANSVFLSGYTQDERRRLIDRVFLEFYNKFGFYPESVGSWWTDSYSLSYMKEKYGVVANLTLSDQYLTDGYQVWGQYWSVPFYPSRFHNGIPASDNSIKLDVVNFQWAPRDPINGYKSSLYSTQDYLTISDMRLDTNYFERLISLFMEQSGNEFNQITVGLEADLSPEVYAGEYKRQMAIVKKFQEEGKIKVLNMKDFSDWYRERFKELSPSQKIYSNDILGSGKEVIWYQSPFYRVGVEFISQGNAKVFDLRIYSSDAIEPYYYSPNRDTKLSVVVPSLFDEIQNSFWTWDLEADLRDFEFLPDRFVIKKNIKNFPKILSEGQVKIKRDLDKTMLIIPRSSVTGKDSTVFRYLSVETLHLFRSPKAILGLLLGKGWEKIKFDNYFVPQGEIDALLHLKALPEGRVLVFDKECLQCEWHTYYKPAVFANLRGYVKDYSGHSIIKNQKVFEASDRENSLAEFNKTKAEFIYLVQFEGYKETLPFSPGDLNLEQVYSNTNAQIWKVKK